MIQIEFTLPNNEYYPKCTAVLDGDMITIAKIYYKGNEAIVYRLPKKDLQDIVASKRSKPHSPIGIYHEDTSVVYQPLPNTLTVTTEGNQFPFEFGYFYLNKIIDKL